MLLQLNHRHRFHNLLVRHCPFIQVLSNSSALARHGAVQITLAGQSCYLAPLSLNCLNNFPAFSASNLNAQDLPPELRLAAFELALKDFFLQLTELLGPVSVEGYLSYEELSALNLQESIPLSLNLEGYHENLIWFLNNDSAFEPFIDCLERHQELPSDTHLTVRAYVLLESLNLTLGELKSLNVGDALLFASFINNDRFIIKCAQQRAIAVLNTATTKDENSTPGSDYYLVMVEPFVADEQEHDLGESMSLDNLDTLPVKVDCVLSSFDMTIGDLKNLSPGARMPLNEDSLSNIKIYVNQHLVALGKVIEIDGTYALQIKELMDTTSKDKA